MDKQIIKNIIIEKQIAIPNYKLAHRDFLFGDKSNYILVGIRRAGKSYLLYQDIQTRLNKGEQSAQDILYINFEDERLSSLKAEELGTILDSYKVFHNEYWIIEFHLSNWKKIFSQLERLFFITTSRRFHRL